jgi:hypothetical protein
VLIPAPAIIIIFLHFFSFIKFAISTMDDTDIVLNPLALADLGFLGEILDRSGGWGLGVRERFLNDAASPLSDWLLTIFF